MKIYYIYSNLPSYRSDFFAGLSKTLKNQGIDLAVLHGMQTIDKVVAQDDNSDYKKNAFDSMRRKIGPIKFTVIKNLFKYIKNGQPDGIVISYMSTNLTMIRVVLYCIAKKIPYATWRCGYNRPDYSNFSNKIRQSLIRFVEKKATLNITYGSHYKNSLEKKGIKSDKIIIAQNTINIEKILEDNCNIKRQFTAKTKILFVGALIKGKLLQSSIDAVKLLIDDGYDVCFNIVGGGAIIKEIKNYISDLHLENYVHVTGPKYKEEVRRYFNESDIFLLAGTGGLAINEAMAYGLPIISTNADGTVCDLINGNGYFMSEFGNSNMQYNFLKKFIELSTEEKSKMSERSKEIIKSKASLENMIKKHHEAINYLTQQK